MGKVFIERSQSSMGELFYHHVLSVLRSGPDILRNFPSQVSFCSYNERESKSLS